MIQPFVLDCAVVALDICVLLGLPRLDVLDGDLVLLSPYSQLFADVFGPIIHPDRARLSPPFDDPVEAACHPFGWQREIDLDPQPFAIEVIKDIQQAKRTTVTQPVGHEPQVREAKSMDQVTLGAAGTASTSGFSRLSRLRGVRHWT